MGLEEVFLGLVGVFEIAQSAETAGPNRYTGSAKASFLIGWCALRRPGAHRGAGMAVK